MVDRVLAVARDRLVMLRDDALLIEAAGLLKEPQYNLVVICDQTGKMAGVITKTDVVRQISYCAGSSCITPAVEVMTRD